MTHPPTNWRKSSYSDSGQQCVELATSPGGAHVRDSKRPDDGYLTVDASHLRAFIDAARSGKLDHCV